MVPLIVDAIIGGVVAFCFGLISWQLHEMKKDNEANRLEHKRIAIAERELLLANTDLNILTARKVCNSASVNGEMEKCISYTEEKKHEVQDLTRDAYFEHVDK